MDRLRAWARALKRELTVIGAVYRHPATPPQARLAAWLVVAYALCPLDLIPDFVPVLGYLDDLVLLPLGIWLTLRMVPPEVLAECRRQTTDEPLAGSGSGCAVVVVSLWLLLLGAIFAGGYRLWVARSQV